LGNDGLLTLLDNKETCAQPNQNHNTRHHAQQTTGLLEIRIETAATAGWLVAAASVLTQEFIQFAAEITPQLIQIRRAIG
jgi:hypothetical protein